MTTVANHWTFKWADETAVMLREYGLHPEVTYNSTVGDTFKVNVPDDEAEQARRIFQVWIAVGRKRERMPGQGAE